MMRTLTTAAIALALGVVWTAGPALAQTTTGEKAKDKAERAGDKLERAADKTGDKLKSAADKAEDKADRAADKGESKMERAKDKARDLKDKAKDKTTELKDKAKAKMDRAETKADKKDIESMQQALKDKGHDPGAIDGRMGPRTRAALMDYQRKEGLKATGRWNDETAAKLGVRMSATDKDTVTPAASPGTATAPAQPGASPQPTPSTPAGTSTAPPATPEDKTAPPAKRNAP